MIAVLTDQIAQYCCALSSVLCIIHEWMGPNKQNNQRTSKVPRWISFYVVLCVTQNAKKRTYTASVAQTSLGKPPPHIPKVVLFLFCRHCGTSNSNQSKECECVVK